MLAAQPAGLGLHRQGIAFGQSRQGRCPSRAGGRSSSDGSCVDFMSFWSKKRLTRESESAGSRIKRKPRAVTAAAMDVPDFLPSLWTKGRENKPLGPSVEYSAEDSIIKQLGALKQNDTPYPDHGIEVMYRFAGFDPFKRSTYFGHRYDLGQFERFRRIFHHSSYRALLGYKEHKVLSTFSVNEHCFKQRIWICGARPGDEETFEFTVAQRVGGSWDGYWLTDSLIQDGDGLSRGIAY